MRMPRVRLLMPLLLLCAVVFGPLPAPAQNIEVYPNLTYTAARETPLALDLYLPQLTAKTVPVILAIHGGSWVAGSRDDLRAYAEVLAAQGYAVVAPDYRLAPDYPYPAQLDDMRQAARWVRVHAGQYHFDMARFHLFGFSAGGYLAALLGVWPGKDVPRAASVISCSGPMDFTAPVPSLRAQAAVRVFLDAEREEKPALYRNASPISHISVQSPPFLLIHGTGDSFVPYSQSARMAKALQRANVPCVLYPVAGMDHELPAPDTPRGKEILTVILKFLARRGGSK